MNIHPRNSEGRRNGGSDADVPPGGVGTGRFRGTRNEGSGIRGRETKVPGAGGRSAPTTMGSSATDPACRLAVVRGDGFPEGLFGSLVGRVVRVSNGWRRPLNPLMRLATPGS